MMDQASNNLGMLLLARKYKRRVAVRTTESKKKGNVGVSFRLRIREMPLFWNLSAYLCEKSSLF